MPQIYQSRNNSTISSRGASAMQQNAFMDQTAAARERKLRSDAALNKATQALQTMKAPLGSEITNNDGVVNSNNALQDSMKPKTQDKSKTGRSGLRMDLVKSAADKTLEGMQAFGALQGDKTHLEGIKQQALDAAMGAVDAKVKGGYGVEGGGSSSANATSSSGLSKSISIGERSVNMPGSDFVTSGNFQQGFDDSFKRDTEGAWKQALMNDIISTASGEVYDPNKDVYLQQANQRDAAYNETLANEMKINASLTKFERGNEMAIGAGRQDVSLSTNESESNSRSTNIPTPPRPGIDELEHNNPIVSYDYTDPVTGKRTQQTMRGRLEDGTNVVLPPTQFGTNSTIDEDNLNGMVSVSGLSQDRGYWSWLPKMIGGGIDKINDYNGFKNNKTFFNSETNRPTKEGLKVIGYGALRQLVDNDPALTKQLIEDNKVVSNLSDNSVTVKVPDSGRNGAPEVAVRVYIGTDGQPKFVPLGDISMQLAQRLKGSLKQGDKNIRTEVQKK